MPVCWFADGLPDASGVHAPRFVRFRERVRAAIAEFPTPPRDRRRCASRTPRRFSHTARMNRSTTHAPATASWERC